MPFDPAVNAENPVFVVGIFRSGTSLLCSLMNQNPRLALMYECDVWNFPKPLLGWRFRRNWAERIEFFNNTLSRHRMAAGKDPAQLMRIRTPLDLYRDFAGQKGASICGEKSPFYCDRIGQLHQQYPGAAFIVVWRTPVEVYRSVRKAGQTSRFFGKPGMLSRMIYQQEQLIRQVGCIEQKGARIYRVDYANLVDHTEAVCREVCVFLRVPFDPQMLQLNKADLSTIYTAPHHAFLRRGVIARQQYTEELVKPSIARKLERYRRRWEQMQGRLPNPSSSTGAGLPGPLELLRHQAAGRLFTLHDSLVRAIFEFMPLPWLRIYRLLKEWMLNRPLEPDEKISLLDDGRKNWTTLLTATLLVAGVAWIHLHSDPHLFFVLFYGVPCVLVALVVNARWATLFVIACSFISPLVQYDGDPDYRSAFVFIWNSASRLILLEALVLMLGRIRMELSRLNPETGPGAPGRKAPGD